MDSAALRRSACCDLVSELARSSGEVTLKLTGTSMAPALWPGDVVTVRRCDFSELKPGQIVLYLGDGALTAHRILSISSGHLVSRGDSLSHCDPPVPEFGVVGRVVCAVRNGRPVSLQRSLWHRLFSILVRRSSLCRHVTLRLGSGLWNA